MVLNVDVAPTLLEAAGVKSGMDVDGRSFLALLRGQKVSGWRDSFVYTYYWESYFPHTPTVFALREDRYKFMYYHGIWDRNELYDLEADPIERVNLIESPAHRERAEAMRVKLFQWLESMGAVDVKFQPPVAGQADERLLH
jgi:arylsulfatase A-like enzyme